MPKIKSKGFGFSAGGTSTNTPDAPNGVGRPPSGTAEGSQAFYDWLAMQPKATREWYIEGRYDAIKGKADSDSRIKAARQEQDKLMQAQENALASGQHPPDVDASGGGFHFSTEKAREQFMQESRVREAGANAKEGAGITPADTTFNPTYVPTDAEAANPQFKQIGDPGQEQVDQEAAINQVRTDTTGVDAQKQSLQDYTSAINQGGLTAIDRARLQDSQMKRGMEARAAEQAIMQRAEGQGRAGSNAQLMMQQQAQQGSENQQSQENAQTMALGLERKDAMIGARGTLGGAVQGTQDLIDHFNTQNQRDVEHANKMAANSAHHTDIGASRDVNKTNTDIANQGIAAGISYRTGQNTANTAIANAAEGINKGPTGGARGALESHMAATQPLLGVQGETVAGSHAHQIEANQAQAQSDALPWQVAGTVLQAAPTIYKAASGH